MTARVQRVLSAAVTAADKRGGVTGKGMLVLVSAEGGDTDRQVVWMANRLLGMRIFEDGEGKMNLACSDIGGEFLVVSNFTVAGDTQSGRRPSFTRAAGFERGKVLFDSLVS